MPSISSVTEGGSAGLTVQRSGGLAASFDSFLQLLTKQLENQDPLAPMDATKFTSQLVEFASVEQAMRANNRLDQLVGSMQTSTRTAALGYLGNHVTVDTGMAQLGDEGGAQFTYQLPSSAKQAVVRVADSDGRVVRILDGGRLAGSNTVAWDGKDTNGARVKAGVYHIDVEAIGRDDRELLVNTDLEGDVMRLTSVGSQLVVDIGQRLVPIDAIRSVRPGGSA
jgi:flagellar basal-body rod modification protein FlgD